jgi:1-aminocyclopropane-1-carboxylate deaminase
LLSPQNIVLQKIEDELINSNGVNLYLLRLDLIHEHISGNKWFKLKRNIQIAKEHGKSTILTFGGAFSNHIAATAFAGKEFGLKTIGLIRGDKISPLNPTLTFAEECNMQLEFISREDYKKKNGESFIADLTNKYGDFYLIPEGGANIEGAIGCQEIIEFTKKYNIHFDTICCACGTGTTLAGIISALESNENALGFSALKGEDELTPSITKILESINPDKNLNNWKINFDYHFGGYAKHKPELIDFMNEFYSKHKIPLDFVYTGKMMFGIYDLIQKKEFKRGANILAMHSGGLQGNKGLPAKTFVFK